jgi:flagellin-specific chaperone FliS
MKQVQGRATAYKEQQIMTASPLDLVIITYDAALMGCTTADPQRSLQALSQLRSCLNWEAAPEVAPRLQALYEYCEECIRQRDYGVPERILRELRDTWVEVRRRTVAGRVQQAARPAAPARATMGAFSVAG